MSKSEAKIRLVPFFYPSEIDEIEEYDTVYFMNLFD